MSVMVRLSKVGSDALSLDILGDGVKGYALENGLEVYIPVVYAVKPGNGEVGKWLNNLPSNVVFPTVISERFRKMIERRGWKMELEYDPIFGECKVWRKP